MEPALFRKKLDKVEMTVFRVLEKLAASLRAQRVGLVLCVSGGRDSTVLFTTLIRLLASPLSKKLPLLFIEVVHFNHHKRGEESDGDAFFVNQLCVQNNIPCHVLDLDLVSEGGSGAKNFHQIAHDWRYREAHKLRESLQEKYNCDSTFVATAHHLNDNLETVLFNLIRGAGLFGLQGIQDLDLKGHLIRPLISISSLELDSYVQHNKIEFRLDSSNLKTDYTRNFIRHKVVPLLEELNPKVATSFARLGRNAEQALDLINTPCTDGRLELHNNITTFEILVFIRKYYYGIYEIIKQTSLENLYHHIQLSKETKQNYTIEIGDGWKASCTDSFLYFTKDGS